VGLSLLVNFIRIVSCGSGRLGRLVSQVGQVGKVCVCIIITCTHKA